MVLRGWGARVCALSKSRTRAREPGGGSRPGLLSLGHHHCLPPLSLAARRSIRLPRTCRAPLCLICPQVVWWRWRWWRRRAAHHSLALALAVSLSLDLSLDLSLSRPLLVHSTTVRHRVPPLSAATASSPPTCDTRRIFAGRSASSFCFSTVHLLEMQGWMRKIFSPPADPYINRSVSRSAFHCTFYFLQQSSFRIFIARSLLSPVPVNPTQALK